MDQTVSDMLAIAEATLNYNIQPGMAASITDLAPVYLPSVVVQNAFGNPYVLSCVTGNVSVSSKTPAGLVKTHSWFTVTGELCGEDTT